MKSIVYDADTCEKGIYLQDEHWSSDEPAHPLSINRAFDARSNNIWAASWQNQRNGMRTQWRLRSAWASAQSDQSLCFVLNG